MKGLDSEEAYADLAISIGQVFNGTVSLFLKLIIEEIISKLITSHKHNLDY